MKRALMTKPGMMMDALGSNHSDFFKNNETENVHPKYKFSSSFQFSNFVSVKSVLESNKMKDCISAFLEILIRQYFVYRRQANKELFG